MQIPEVATAIEAIAADLETHKTIADPQSYLRRYEDINGAYADSPKWVKRLGY